MIENQDILELIDLLNAHEVRYILVGGYAVMYYAEPRYTKDVDFLIDCTAENATAIIAALSEFGIPEQQLSHDLFASSGNFFKVGKPPWRVDFITSLEGASFDELYTRSLEISVGERVIKIISKNDLVTIKKLAGRPQDLLDCNLLEKA